MYNDDYDRENEKEEQSLLKDMAKKGISKSIKTKPPFDYLILFVVICFIVAFLMLISVLSSLSMFFFFNDDEDNDVSRDSNLAYVGINSEDNYWWPIGGAEVETLDEKEYATGDPTATFVTSEFSNRELNGQKEFHSGIDIGGSGRETDYVIAASKGIVEYVNNSCLNNGSLENTCGGELGNYVKIKHSGGNYTIYAHLLPNSIRVSVGDVVNQGQIIGEMGNSGKSTGKHLHFQVVVSNDAQNPRNYVSPENPRPVTISSGSNTTETGENNLLLSMLQSWEGTGPTDGDYYIVYDDGTGVLTVGHGVTLKWNKDRFIARNVDYSSLEKNSKIAKSIVDDIELEIVNEKKLSVINLLSSNNITLEDYQVDALVIRMYNIGNVGGFPDKYREYGNTQALYDNYMKDPTTANNVVLSGLVRRRDAEWNLFHNGIYTFNS